METRTTFTTTHAQRYLGTLCKHFGRKVPVQFDTQAGVIDLPFGRCALRGSDTDLELSITASSQRDLDKTVQVISSHLERFAFRENPTLVWQEAPAGSHSSQPQ